MRSVPATPGGALAGTIHVTRVVDFQSPMQLRLACVHLTRAGNHKNDGFFEVNEWQSEQTLDRLPHTSAGIEIPVFFNIPADARPCDDSNPNDQFVWRLEARAASAGVSYFAQFEVPVFVADAAPAPLKDDAALYRHREIPVPSQKIREPGIEIRPLPGDGLEIRFAAARNKKLGTMMVIFALIFAGVSLAMVLCVQSEPFLWRLIWYCGAGVTGFFALIICLGAVSAWLVSSEITVNHGSATLSQGIWFLRLRKTMAGKEIAGIASTKTGDAGGQPFYGIELKKPDGNVIRIGDYIRQKDYAAWLAGEIAARLGVSKI